MIRAFVVSSVLLIAGAAAADPQPQPQLPQLYQEEVTLSGFDPVANTYVAQVHIAANPCQGAVYSVYFNIGGVKDVPDAKDKVKANVEKIADDIRKAAEACHVNQH